MSHAPKREEPARRSPAGVTRQRVDQEIRAYFDRLCADVVVTEAELDVIRNFQFGK